MRYAQYESGDISYAYKINSISDVLDLTRFKKRSFSSYKELLKTNTEAEAKKIATDVFVSFLKKVSIDLIEENNIYVFPSPSFGYIKISNTANVNREDYVYNIEQEGKIFTPRLKLDKTLIKRNKKHYKFRFNYELRKRMVELILKGHKYG